MWKRIVTLCVVMTILGISVCGVLFYFSNETKDIEDQEYISELVAEKYLIHVSQQGQNDESVSPQDPTTNDPSDLEYDDNEIYSYFDESYAHGYVDCVLEIPALDLRQSIFTGTSDQIEHDLRNWLPVTARADYVLGDTHYCIYMHNPRNKSIKISYAQEKLREKDYMVVTKQNSVYLYEVTGVFAEWRNKCTDNYVNNMAVSNNKLYIFTCGRNEWQGRNTVVEGTVHSVYKTTDWAKNKDRYIEEYKQSVGTLVKEEPVIKDRLVLSVETHDKTILLSLHDKNYSNVSGCTIGICDADGYLVEGIENPIKYEGEQITISYLPEGEYYIGVYENNTEYADPTPYKIVVNKQTYTQSVVTIDQEVVENRRHVETMRIVATVLFVFAFGLGIVAIIRIACGSKKNNV